MDLSMLTAISPISISLASVRNTKASSFRCGSLPNQSRGFDLERKNGGADTEPSRVRAAAAWSKPILTTPQGVFPPHMSPEKRSDWICPVGQTLRGTHPGDLAPYTVRRLYRRGRRPGDPRGTLPVTNAPRRIRTARKSPP